MTSPAASLLVSTAAAKRRPWNAGLAEFALAGGITPLLFPLSFCLRSIAGLDAAELAVGYLAFHAAFIINDPHFSVTYLLFYKNVKARAFGSAFAPKQRLRYW